MGIFVDEVGYPLNGTNQVAITTKSGCYSVIDCNTNNVIKEVEAIHRCSDAVSGDDCYSIDLTEVVRTPGTYVIKSADGILSDSFKVSEDVYRDLNNALIKALYFQRCGCGLDEKYAGVYKHDICHNREAYLLEDYLEGKDNSQSFDVTGGWHDAGDFGRYISPAAVAVGHLLYAYEMFGEKPFMDSLNIPESGNGIADVLNEVRYELEWMLKMQRADGGVYHKVTTFTHADFIMPEFDDGKLLIFPVSSMSTADFCAAMAIAHRVYKNIDNNFADKMMEAANKAYNWLAENPEYLGFHNPEGSNTGEYDDEEDRDERMWAAAEMLRSVDGDVSLYLNDLEKYADSEIGKTDFGWTDVAGFAMLSVLTDKEKKAGDRIISIFAEALYTEADRLLDIEMESGYILGMKEEDFVWGSNMVVANRGMLMVLADILAERFGKDKDDEYRNSALNYLHYILGRNALGRSYVTGFGEHAYKNPHNRTSSCDGVEEAMPGWVSGGPFRTPMDPDAQAIIPEGTPAMKCHADVDGSYSTNEITIYWNSPVAFITSYLLK